MAIKFDRFWDLLEKKGLSQYDLISNYGLSAATVNKLKHNKNLETRTLNRLCEILDCKLEDIAEYVKD